MAYKQLKLWFDEELAKMLAEKIVAIHPAFPKQKFIKEIKSAVPDLELKPRVAIIADTLAKYLPYDFSNNIKILLQILGPENEEETGMFTNYYWIMPIAVYVEKYGLEEFDASMKAIAEITKRNTGEYAIRPFIEKYPSQTLQQMKAWSRHKNKHIRRLSSEGGRPRLPWATKLTQFIKDPTPLLPILNNLKDDPSKYVQKSVANCVNDLLKDNEAIGRALLEDWQKGATKERKWIIKHALRNFLKKEIDWAIELGR